MAEVAIPQRELDRLLGNAGKAILVGGQALAFWISYYAIPIDDAPVPIVTKDADFFGNRSDAERFSKITGGKLEHPKGMSILAGLIVKKISAADEFQVDVLRAINGVSTVQLIRNAKKIEDRSRGADYLVMSPVECLISRLENLRTIEAKRNDIGIWQARVAVRVARKHIEDLLASGREREVIRAATAILRASLHPMGMNAFKNYAIDSLDAVPIESFQNKAFLTEQWPRSLARVEQGRALLSRRKITGE